MQIKFDKSTVQNFDEAIKYEWLETNGLGGWASSTIIGANTRRYHGLLVAASNPPVGRLVLVSKLDETLVIHGHRYELGCNIFPEIVSPEGYKYLHHFEKNLFPVFEYHAGGVEIRKTIVALHGENTTLVLYEVLQAISSFTLELQPFIAARDHHRLTHENDAVGHTIKFSADTLRVHPYYGQEIFMVVPNSTFEAWPEWYHNFQYPVEKYRGMDYQEDLFTYGVFKTILNLGDKLGIIISTNNPVEKDAFALFEQEKERRNKLFERLPLQDEFAKTLCLAADQFIVKRDEQSKSIIAGYHWFTDWGRDTMIALPGLTLVTGRFDDANKILQTFTSHISNGMLPNRFPDGGEETEYNTADATLWFFIAICKYIKYTGDHQFAIQHLLPSLREIIRWHYEGTRHNIHVDDDGLLYAGEPGIQLTWMDAKVGEWVITPRMGKAVEINALWYNALRIYASLLRKSGDKKEAKIYEIGAKKVKTNFINKFWNEELGYLYDVIDGDTTDSSLRPNQLLALSLPFPLITGSKARSILKIISQKLYTPFGLRSLSPDDPAYRSHYGGDQLSRDSAYHQGTVWAWLLGPFISALVNVYRETGREKSEKIIENIKPHLVQAGLGTISEIFDGEPPHSPRGCIAQAWSVGEILRAYVEDVKKVEQIKII